MACPKCNKLREIFALLSEIHSVINALEITSVYPNVPEDDAFNRLDALNNNLKPLMDKYWSMFDGLDGEQEKPKNNYKISVNGIENWIFAEDKLQDLLEFLRNNCIGNYMLPVTVDWLKAENHTCNKPKPEKIEPYEDKWYGDEHINGLIFEFNFEVNKSLKEIIDTINRMNGYDE